MFPWHDRAGRVSLFKLLVFLLLFVPGTLTAVDFAQGALGARPITEIIRDTGLWAIRFLLISLAITPLRETLGWPRLVAVRRMIGVATFVYAAIHLIAYTADKMFDLEKVAIEIILSTYLTIGFAALLALTALAATSTDGMMRRMGGKRWRRLQQLVYAIGILASIHYFMQSKANVTEPTLMGGFLLWLLGYRVLGRFKAEGGALPFLWLAALAPAAWALTVVGEWAYYGIATGINPALVFDANFTLMSGVRPGWWVLMAAALIAAACGVRTLARGGRARSGTAAPYARAASSAGGDGT